MVPSAYVEIIKKYVDCYNKSDIPGMLECVSEDVTFRYINDGMVTTELSGKTAFEAFASRAAKRYKVREQIIKSIDMDFDCIEVIVGHHSVLADTTLGANPYVSKTGISKFVFEDDKIIELSDIV